MTSVPHMTYNDPKLPDTLLEPAARAVLGDGGVHRAACTAADAFSLVPSWRIGFEKGKLDEGFIKN